jgi:hypothetical protein
MSLPRRFWPVAVSIAVLSFAALLSPDRVASEPKGNSDAEAIQELQKQVAELKAQVKELQKSRIVAAGTANWTRPKNQENKTNTRVKLPADVAAGIGKDYIVFLSNRFPKGGYPYFEAYWKPASDGFDIILVDPSLSDGASASYDNPSTEYPIDWIVVKK